VRLSSNRKPSAYREREDQLRKARTAAPTLREVHPGTSLVNVQLQFDTTAMPNHAPQSFTLYPPARLYLSYPCPFGDCTGVFELGAAAGPALRGERHTVSGSMECGGLRSRDGAQGQACGLGLKYSITAQQEPRGPSR
jgi:hypothetical protein